MLHPQTLYNKINHLYEIALSIVCSDYKSSVNELLQKDHSFTTHYRNIQILSFPFEPRNCNIFRSRRASSVKYGKEII